MITDTNIKQVELPRTLVNQLLTHAQSSPEQEVCGLISTRNGAPHKVYRINNAAEQPQRLFAMEPEQQINAMREMREAGEDLFAIYHSHPHSPAQPSLTDLQESAYPEALYLIISLDTEGVLQLKGFYLDAHRENIQNIDLSVVSTAGEFQVPNPD